MYQSAGTGSLQWTDGTRVPVRLTAQLFLQLNYSLEDVETPRGGGPPRIDLDPLQPAHATITAPSRVHVPLPERAPGSLQPQVKGQQRQKPANREAETPPA